MLNFKQKLAQQLVNEGYIKKAGNYKNPKSYDDLKAGEWYRFNGKIVQIDEHQPRESEIWMYRVYPEDLHVGTQTVSAYKGFFKPTDFVYVNKKELIKEKALKQTKTIYSVELFNSDGDTETSTDCNSYDEAIKAMEDYKNKKTQYVDSWGLSGKGRIIKYTQDEDGNISNEKVLKTFWL